MRMDEVISFVVTSLSKGFFNLHCFRSPGWFRGERIRVFVVDNRMEGEHVAESQDSALETKIKGNIHIL